MKKVYFKNLSLIVFTIFSINTVIADSIGLKGEEMRSISQPTNTESLELKEESKLTITSPGSLTVAGGNISDIVLLKDEGLLSVNINGTLIIFGNVLIKDEAELLIYGRVVINGNLEIKGEGKISGNGQLVVTGTIVKKDEASIDAGIKLSKDGAVVTSTSDGLNVDLLTNEKATIAVYNLQGQLLTFIEDSESTKIDLKRVKASSSEILIVKVTVGEKVYSSRVIKL